MKRLFTLILALSLAMSLMAAPSIAEETDKAFSRFDEVVEVHIGMGISATDNTLPEGDSAENNQYTRHLLEKYNIKVVVDWTAASGEDYNQKVALCIASNSMPDALVAPDRTYFLAAADSDMLYDLTTVFDEYASDQVKEIMAATNGRANEWVNYGGQMLAIPSISVQADGITLMMIQQNWLDALNLEVPKTLDDVHAVAQAFKEAGLAGDATIPILGAQKNTRVYANFLNSANATASFDPIFAAMGAFPGYFLLDENGKVTYGTLSTEMRSSLELLAKWYAEGLIDPEFSTRDSFNDPINANSCGIFFGPWWAIGYGNGDSFKNSEDVNWQAYPLYTDAGEWKLKTNAIGTNYLMVNKNASEDVARAVTIINNVLVRDEGAFDTTVNIEWYPLRVNMAAADECEYGYRELVKVLNGETNPEDYADVLLYKLLYSDAQTVRETVPGFVQGERIERKDFSMTNESVFQRMYSMLIGCRAFSTEKSELVESVSYATNEAIDRYWSNLEALEDSVVRSIITGNSDITAFDSFVEQWLNEGGDKILEAVQAEYDAAR